ncbi:MAG TPA: hypothetical protein VFE20_08110 [Thermoleophilia bacterium]|nr:hypothetical protein [Thermoleophilia bacterium]
MKQDATGSEEIATVGGPVPGSGGIAMKHMVVSTHNPESCGFRSAEDNRLLFDALRRIPEVAATNGAELVDVWVSPTSHTMFLLIEAPHAHAVDDVIRESGFIGRVDSRILPVYGLTELEERTAGE